MGQKGCLPNAVQVETQVQYQGRYCGRTFIGGLRRAECYGYDVIRLWDVRSLRRVGSKVCDGERDEHVNAARVSLFTLLVVTTNAGKGGAGEGVGDEIPVYAAVCLKPVWLARRPARGRYT